MDFRLTDEQIEFQRHCRKFSTDVIRPVAAKYDREQSVPWDVIKEARKWDLHGLDYIQKVASDADGLFGVIYAEELHWGCAGIALAISASSLAAAGIASSGTPEQIGRWVPECYGTGDEIKLGAYAVTEAGAGSDVKSLRTTAKLDGDEWVLNGTKVFISNGGIADVTVVVATVDPELGHRGQASFVVPKETPGLSQGKKEDKIGTAAPATSVPASTTAPTPSTSPAAESAPAETAAAATGAPTLQDLLGLEDANIVTPDVALLGGADFATGVNTRIPFAVIDKQSGESVRPDGDTAEVYLAPDAQTPAIGPFQATWRSLEVPGRDVRPRHPARRAGPRTSRCRPRGRTSSSRATPSTARSAVPTPA